MYLYAKIGRAARGRKDSNVPGPAPKGVCRTDCGRNRDDQENRVTRPSAIHRAGQEDWRVLSSLPTYLLENKLYRKPVTNDGEPWSAKTFWQLRPPSLEDRFVDLLITSILFHNYRRCRGGLLRVKNPLVASSRLEDLFDKAYAKFLKEYPEAAKGDHVTLRHVVADAEAHFRSKLTNEAAEELMERDLSGHRL